MYRSWIALRACWALLRMLARETFCEDPESMNGNSSSTAKARFETAPVLTTVTNSVSLSSPVADDEFFWSSELFIVARMKMLLEGSGSDSVPMTMLIRSPQAVVVNEAGSVRIENKRPFPMAVTGIEALDIVVSFLCLKISKHFIYFKYN
jgi:hypothetical protein